MFTARRLATIYFVSFSAGIWTGAVGCTRGSLDPDVQNQADGVTADEIVSRMAAVYRQAESYVDNAQYHQRYTLRNDGIEYDVPSHVVSCAFARPNRLRINREVPAVDAPGLSATVTSNGIIMRAFVSDYVGQVWESVAPQVVTPEKVLASQPVREALLPVPLENLYPQVDLLLATADRPSRLLTTGKLTRLDDRELDGALCHRVQLLRPDEGPRVLWIDQQTHLLRRMEMPTANVRAAMDAEGVLTNLELWIDFHDAKVGLGIEDAVFEMEVPDGATRVRELVMPPQSPPTWLGERPHDFAFSQLDGGTVTADSLVGDVVLLDFWFTGCAPCQQSMPALETLYQSYRDRDDVQFYAASVDSHEISDEKLLATLKQWGASMPVLRDNDHHGEEYFGVTGYPTTILLGPAGTIQRVSQGAESSYESWRETIDKLLAGEDVAEQSLAEYRQALEEHAAAVAAVTIDAGEPAVDSGNDAGAKTNASPEE